MAVSFTKEQQRVIDLHGCNILVSAAAGSGKTAVLVERIVKMICDEEKKVDIDRLLVVTFTNAAAAEMRERIGTAIQERLKLNPSSEHLQRQATLLHNALITTIDSFSLFIIRNHFHEIGLDPGFRVADEGEIKLMSAEALTEVLEEAFASKEESFIKCVESFCPGGKDSALEGHILDLAKYAASFPWPILWLWQRKKDYDASSLEELLGGECGAYLTHYSKEVLLGCATKMERALKLCNEPDGPYYYGDLFEKEVEKLQSLATIEDVQQLFGALEHLSFDRLPSKKDDSVNAEKKEQAKKLRDDMKGSLGKLKTKFFETPFDLSLQQSMACKEPMNALLDLTIAYVERLQQKKQEKKIIDFSDMEHFALEILTKREGDQVLPSDVALEYKEHFHEILIDEYQDSNLVQEYLLKAISGEDCGKYNRFMVGDVKQSIYKFRLARPELFLEKYEKEYGDEGNFVRLDLSKNFRSRDTVIHSVNSIFDKTMSKACGGIAYDEKAMLYVGADYKKDPDNLSGSDKAEAKASSMFQSEMLFVEKPDKGEDIDGKEAEAKAIARKILELKANGLVTDKETKEFRQPRFSDMVILLRSLSGFDETFKSVLEQNGIPVYIPSKTGYFAAAEVQALLNVLRVLDNPMQDIPLFGMMKSVFGGFTEEEISIIRSRDKKISLYESLKTFAEENEKCKAFLEKIERYRDLVVYMPIRDLVQKLVEDHDYLSYVTALPGGSKKRANVEMFFTKASDFEKTSYFGLFHFIHYIEQLEKYNVDYGEADTLDENADVVRIMTIHKSKGLEFPITFVAGMAKQFNLQDARQAMIVDVDLGVAINYLDPVSRLKNKTLRHQVLAAKMVEDSLAEELRVFYVALTRAKEKLIMTCCVPEPAELVEKLQNTKWDESVLGYMDFVEAKNYLDFLMPVLPGCDLALSAITVEELAGEEIKEQMELEKRMERLQRAKEQVDSTMLEALREKFSRVYLHENLANLYTKTTVSELKISAMSEKDEAAFHSFEEKEVVPYIPTFKREEEAVSGAVRGNAYHKAMELLDFQELLGQQFGTVPADYAAYKQGLDTRKLYQDIEAFLQKNVESLRMPQEYYGALQFKKLVNFCSSEIGYRMWKAQVAGELYREQPFVLGIEAARIDEKFPEEEKVLIQGIIDVFFIEDGEIVLLDYKTDIIANMEALWNRYEVQIAYYQEAIERLMDKKVKEKRLYSFYLEEC